MIPSIEISAISIGVLVGTTTALQQSPVSYEMGMLASIFGSPVGSAIVSALVAYGAIKTSVKVLERDMQDVRRELRDVATRVARIEGKLEADV